MDEFSDRIKQWRLGLKLRQKEAAAVFDVPVGTYRTWEKGSKTPTKLSLCEIERRMKNGLRQTP
jgi:DNA-binding transcriptional regulator YiaG